MYTRFASFVTVVGICLCLFINCFASPRYARGGVPVKPSSKPRIKKSPAPDLQKHFQKGIASYYGPGFQGEKTASGESFNINDLTAAHRTLPFNTKVRVTNLENSKSVIVRINDRGPFKKGRIIDLSLGAAKKIGLLQAGRAKVKLEIVP